MKKIPLICVILIFSLTSPIFASQNQSIINEEDSPVQFFVDYEKGFVSVLSHTIQISKTSPEFNYVTQGGQEILFPFERINVGAVIGSALPFILTPPAPFNVKAPAVVVKLEAAPPLIPIDPIIFIFKLSASISKSPEEYISLTFSLFVYINTLVIIGHIKHPKVKDPKVKGSFNVN